MGLRGRRFTMVTTSTHNIAGLKDAASHAGGVIQLLGRRLPQVVSSLAIAIALSLLYLAVAPRIFSSRSILYIEPNPLGAASDSARGAGASTDFALVDSQAAMLKSDALLRRVVDTLSLEQDSEFSPTRLVAALRSLVSDHPAADAKATAAETLARRIQISREPNTYVVEVQLSARTASKAAQINDTLLSHFLDGQAMAQTDDERRSHELITSRLGALQDEVRLAEDRVADFKRRRRISGSGDAAADERNLDKLHADLASARAAAAEAKGRLDAVHGAATPRAGLDALPEAVRSPTIERLRAELAVVARREAALASQLKPRHPDLVEARSQLREIRSHVDAEIARIAGAMKADYDMAAGRARELQRLIDASQDETSQSSAARIKLQELEQDAAASRELLGAYLRRAKETREAQQIAVPSSRVVSPATSPAEPSGPNVLLVLGLGLFAGLGASVARAYASELSDMTVRIAPGAATFGDLTVFPIPALAPGRGSFMPRWQTATAGRSERTGELGPALIAVSEPQSPPETAYRQRVLQLLAALDHDRSDSYPSAFLIAGADAESGAAAITLALAQSGAGLGERVLLVDADSSRAELSSALAPDVTADWATLLAKPEALADATLHDAASGLSFLPLARADLRLLKRAERRQLAANLAAAALDYDLILIDAGALAIEDSASDLLQLADGIGVVARSGETAKSRLDDLLLTLAPVKDKIAGLVVTGA
jgi:uncharacterized protein involved in exopolysaccharide biosynthesis/Mrp family chromosome partitioning ATPase